MAGYVGSRSANLGLNAPSLNLNALDPALLLGFIQTTQSRLWQSLQAIHKDDTGKVVLDHLVKELDTKGMLKVLRQGFKCYGKKLRVAVFAPNNGLNPDTLALYGQNLLDSHASTFTTSAQFIKAQIPLRPRVVGIKISDSF